MKLRYILLLSFLLTTMMHSQVFDWEWQHPNPHGVNVNDAIILSNGHYLLFGDGGMIMRSTNMGASWSYSYPDSASGNRSIYEADFIDANTGFICGVGGFIYKTTNGGLTWTQQTSGVTVTLWYISFTDANNGYATGDGATVLKTTNGGDTWTPISMSATTGTIYSVYVVPGTSGNIVYVATTSATIGRLARSTNGGASFSPVAGYTSTSSGRSIYFIDADTGFVGNFVNQIWRTTDGGATFANAGGGTGTATIYEFIRLNNNTFMAAGNRGNVFYSNDFGATWSNRDIPNSSNLYSLNNSGTTVLAAGEGGAIARTTDMGLNWDKLSNLETINELRNVQFVSDNVGYAVGGSITPATLAGDILKTTNGGATWVKLPFDPKYRFKGIHFFNENVGFVAGRGPNGLYKTTNGGVTWDSINTGIGTASQVWHALSFANANVGYLVGDNGNYGVTTDGGNTWVQRLNTLHHGTNIIYDISVIDANTAVSLGAGGRVYKTTDQGVTFINQSTLGTTSAMYGIDFLTPTYGMLVGSSGRGHKTTDGGATWLQMTSIGAGTTTLYGIGIVSENIAWISGSSGSVYYTTNGGSSWTKSDKVPFSNRIIYEIIPRGNLVHAVGQSGTILRGYADPAVPVELVSFSANTADGKVVLKWETATEINNSGFSIERSADKSSWSGLGFVSGMGTSTERNTYSFTDADPVFGKGYYRLKQIDYSGAYEYSNIIEVDANVVLSYSLEQNYPNPFNPSTTINYSIPAKEYVTLKVFNAVGEEVMTLVNGIVEMGKHSVQFNGKELASGIYFYQLNAGAYSSVKKLLLLK
jgi:photosystem II stability/assembly factor-like uncharacterized protein